MIGTALSAFKYCLALIGAHQLVTFGIIVVLIRIDVGLVRWFSGVFGDEDYSGSTWIGALLATGIALFTTFSLFMMLLATLTK